MERVKKREKEEAREIHVPITIGRSGNSISNVRGRRSSKFFATKLVRCHRNGKKGIHFVQRPDSGLNDKTT